MENPSPRYARVLHTVTVELHLPEPGCETEEFPRSPADGDRREPSTSVLIIGEGWTFSSDAARVRA